MARSGPQAQLAASQPARRRRARGTTPAPPVLACTPAPPTAAPNAGVGDGLAALLPCRPRCTRRCARVGVDRRREHPGPGDRSRRAPAYRQPNSCATSLDAVGERRSRRRCPYACASPARRRARLDLAVVDRVAERRRAATISGGGVEPSQRRRRERLLALGVGSSSSRPSATTAAAHQRPRSPHAATSRQGTGRRMPRERRARPHDAMNATDERTSRDPRRGGRRGSTGALGPGRSSIGAAGLSRDRRRDVRAAARPLLAPTSPRRCAEIHPDPEVREALLTRLVRARGGGVRRAPGRPAPARPARLLTPDWLQQPRMFGYACYTERFADDLAGRRQAARPPRGARRHLPAPDAAAAAPRGRQRRRLRRAGLPRGPRRPRHHRRPARPRDDAARARASAWCMDLVLNHVAREHEWAVARPGRRPESRVPRLLPRLPRPRPCPTPTSGRCPRCSPTSRPATSPGTTTSRAGSGRRSTSGSGTSTGPTPPCWSSSPRSSCGWPTSGVEVLRLDAIAFLWKRLGTNCQNQPEVHAITQALRAVTRMAAPAVAFKAEAIVGPRDLVQYLGTGRHAGRVSDLAYHNSLMVQVWSMLATGNTVLARQALGALPADARHRHLDHLRPLPRRHRLGDRRPRRPRRRRHRATGTGAFLSDWYAGEFPGSWADGLVFQANPATGDQRISGTAASLAGLSGRRAAGARRRRGRAGPAVPRARGRRRLGRDPGRLERRRARASPTTPTGRRAGPRGRQPLGAPAPAGLVAGGRPRRPAHRARPGLHRAARTWPGSAPGCPQLHASAATEVLQDTDDGVLAVVRRHASGAFVGLYNVTEQAAAVRPAPAARRPASTAPYDALGGHVLAVGGDGRALAPAVRRVVGGGRARSVRFPTTLSAGVPHVPSISRDSLREGHQDLPRHGPARRSTR